MSSLFVAKLISLSFLWGLFGTIFWWFRIRYDFDVEPNRELLTESTQKTVQAKSTQSSWGVGLQIGSVFATLVPSRYLLEQTPTAAVDVILTVIALLLMAAGFAISLAAMHELREQWSLVAQLQRNHRLVTTGPFSRCRHPIYVGFAMIIVGQALMLTGYVMLVLAAISYGLGTWIRTRTEEQLLVSKFGDDYIRYRERVPPFVGIKKYETDG